jgi:hypothetical protein
MTKQTTEIQADGKASLSLARVMANRIKTPPDRASKDAMFCAKFFIGDLTERE